VWKARAGKQGFTLIETLITFTLLAIVGYLFVWILVPSMQMTAKGAARVDVQQLAVLTADKMSRDLQNVSARGAVTLYSRAQADPLGHPVVMAMIPFDDVDQKGRREWEQKVHTYYWNRTDKTISVRVWPPGPPAALSVNPLPLERPTELETADLLALAVQGREMARRVVEFDARWLDDNVKKAVVLEIRVEQEVAGKTSAERFDYQRVVSLRD
jgi:type II secretory pathway pseudopilin PulG